MTNRPAPTRDLTAPPPASLAPSLGAALADLAVLLAFAATGRRAHGETTALAGVLEVVWPFAAGAALGWAVSRAWRRPAGLWPSGLAVWAGAVAGGMALRALTGVGTAASFAVVAILVLAAGLLGWRTIARLAARWTGARR